MNQDAHRSKQEVNHMTNIGAMIVRTVPPRSLVAHAVALEAFYDELWVVEDLPYAGGISQAAAVLAATNDVIVGHGIAPAPFRNPAALAMEWATLAELYPRRFVGGIGHGVQSWMSEIGAKVSSPLTLLSETVSSVQTVLAGETANVDGRYVHLEDVTLVFPPADPPRVSAGVLGPKSLRVSGAIAGGTILPEGHGPAEIRRARALIDEGRQSAGRTDQHHLTVFAGFYVGHSDGLGEANPDAPTGWEAVAATAGEVAVMLGTLTEAGVDSVVLVPMGADPLGQLQLAGEQIVPVLRAS